MSQSIFFLPPHVSISSCSQTRSTSHASLFPLRLLTSLFPLPPTLVSRFLASTVSQLPIYLVSYESSSFESRSPITCSFFHHFPVCSTQFHYPRLFLSGIPHPFHSYLLPHPLTTSLPNYPASNRLLPGSCPVLTLSFCFFLFFPLSYPPFSLVPNP